MSRFNQSFTLIRLARGPFGLKTLFLQERIGKRKKEKIRFLEKTLPKALWTEKGRARMWKKKSD
jgi:hypothetical protein